MELRTPYGVGLFIRIPQLCGELQGDEPVNLLSKYENLDCFLHISMCHPGHGVSA